MPTPAVSVLMPARDAAGTITMAVGSLRRQRFTDWECVVVDDGSEDDTAAIVARAASEDPRVRLIRTPPEGLVAALTRGLAACRGAVVARMDADDVMHRDRIGAQWAALEADGAVGAVGSHVRLFPRAGLSAGRRDYETWLNSMTSPDDIRRDRFVECPIAHPTLAIRRELLAAHRYREGPWAEDYDLVLRLLEGGVRIGVVPRRLLQWRDRADRLSRRDARYGLDRFTACKAAFLAHGFLRDQVSFVLWGYGSTGRALARALAAHGRALACIVEVHPGRIGHVIAGAPVVGLDALARLHGRPIIVSVAGAGPRAEIRAHLRARGFIEERDFLVAA